MLIVTQPVAGCQEKSAGIAPALKTHKLENCSVSIAIADINLLKRLRSYYSYQNLTLQVVISKFSSHVGETMTTTASDNGL